MGITKCLTIAGSDSGGGAGIQADLKTFAALGVYGCSVLTAITAQNTIKVKAVLPVPALMVKEQLETVLEDLKPDAIKTGMLATAETVRIVAEILKAHPTVPLIVDPVMVAKSGDSLLTDEAVAALRDQLLPLAFLVTPNIPEAEVLSGITLKTENDFCQAAKRLRELGARHVLLKGGHRPNVGTGDHPKIVDLFLMVTISMLSAGPGFRRPIRTGLVALLLRPSRPCWAKA